MTLSKYFKYIFPILTVLIAMGVAKYFSGFRESDTPRHWLADVQYNHIAITENLQNNIGSLLQPKSYELTPFGGGKKPTLDGLAEARFPILHTLIGTVTSNQEQQIIVWRFVSFIFFLVAIVFSYLILYQLTRNRLLSLVSTLGVNLTSVALFAQHAVGTYSFIFSLIIGSFYFFIVYLEKDKPLFIYLTIALSGLATLQGHGSVLFLLIYFVYYIYRFISKKEKIKGLEVSVGIFLFFMGMFLYQRVYLLNQNGGLFELGPMFQGGIQVFFKANSKFLMGNAYSISNAFINFFLFTGFILFIYLKYGTQQLLSKVDKVTVLTLFFFLAQIGYYITYVYQLINFDFYALENITPALVILSFVSIGFISKNWVFSNKFLCPSFAIILIISLVSTYKAYSTRFVETEEDRVIKSLDNMVDADLFLEKLNIPKSEKITILNGATGNLSLLKTKRRGYVSKGLKKQDFVDVLEYSDSKYILSQDQLFMYDVVNAYPQILSKLKLISSNETLSLYQKRLETDSISGEVLQDYVLAHNIKNYSEYKQPFNDKNKNDVFWNIPADIIQDTADVSNKYMIVNNKEKYPCTAEIRVGDLKNRPKGVVISSLFFIETGLRKVCFNVSCHRGDDQYYNEIFKVSKKLKGDAINNWTRVSCKVSLPEGEFEDDDIIKVFLWNPHKGRLAMDDFSFIIY